jgi:hypothetical protein
VISFSLLDNRAKRRRVEVGRRHRAGEAERRLRLLPRGDGWSLVGADGELAFSARGLSGRRRCLEFARARGVIALTPR